MKNKPLVIKYAEYLLYKKDITDFVKLNKILYFIYKEHLQLTGKEIFPAKFQAWIKGPVNVEAYNHIKRLILNNLHDPENFDEKDTVEINVKLIDDMLERTKKYSSWDLIEICKDGAWKEARKGYDDNSVCSVELDKEHIRMKLV